MSYKLLLIIFATLFGKTLSNSKGSPKSSCFSMIPGHPSSPKTTPIPYLIHLEKTTIKPEETCNITIGAPGEVREFKGFQLQIRDEKTSEAVGNFLIDLNDNQVKGVDCFKKINSAVTHKNSNKKKEISVVWEAPKTKGNYNVYLTVIQDLSNFWAFNLIENITVSSN